MSRPYYHSIIYGKFFLLSLICLGILFSSCASAFTTINYFTTNLSNSYGHSLSHKLAQSNEHIYIAWSDTGNSSSDKGQIFFRFSNNNGETFSTPVILSDKIGDANLPDLSVDGKNIYVAWEDDYSGESHISFRVSSDNGKSFSRTVGISNGTIGAALPSIGSFKNFVYVVWVGSTAGDQSNFEIFLRTSHDNGRTFGPIINLSKSAGDSTDPKVIVPTDGNDVYVTYTDCDAVHDDPLCGIYFTKSSNSGMIFGSSQLISIIPPATQNLPFLGHSHPPIISSLLSAFGINIHKHIREHNSVIPVITSSEDGKDVYILWEDDLTGTTDIFLRKSNDYGNTFSDSINLSNTPGISRLAQMVTSGNDVYIVWSDTNSTFQQFDVFFTKLTYNGNKVAKTINLSNSKGNSAPSDIGIINNSKSIYIAWTENSAIDKNNLLVVKSNDGGTTFEKPTQLISKNSLNPALIDISDKNSTGMIWTEYGNKAENLYFAKIN